MNVGRSRGRKGRLLDSLIDQAVLQNAAHWTDWGRHGIAFRFITWNISSTWYKFLSVLTYYNGYMGNRKEAKVYKWMFWVNLTWVNASLKPLPTAGCHERACAYLCAHSLLLLSPLLHAAVTNIHRHSWTRLLSLVWSYWCLCAGSSFFIYINIEVREQLSRTPLEYNTTIHLQFWKMPLKNLQQLWSHLLRCFAKRVAKHTF